jgi:surfeit locus 1 family protein
MRGGRVSVTRRFAPRPLPTVAAAALIALTLWLGVWQTHRAEEKTVRQALLEAREKDPAVTLTGSLGTAEMLLFRHVRARGRFNGDGQVYIDNKVDGGRAGFHVVTPLRIEGSGVVVLVNRGWVARGPQYPEPPAVTIPAGDVLVEGLATVPPARVLELSRDTVTGKVWQNLAIAKYAQAFRVEVLPVVVLAVPAGAGLVAVTESPDAGIARHQEYALTWFSLAITVLVLWIALNIEKVPRGD